MNPDAGTFQNVRDRFLVLGVNVFNPDMDMSRLQVDGGASGALTTMVGGAEWSATGLPGASLGAPAYLALATLGAPREACSLSGDR